MEELEKAIEAGKETEIQENKRLQLKLLLKKQKKILKNTVTESKIESLLRNKFTEPTQPIVLAYSFTKKADPAKVNYYVKIANGDLSTQAKIVAAKLVKDAN